MKPEVGKKVSLFLFCFVFYYRGPVGYPDTIVELFRKVESRCTALNTQQLEMGAIVHTSSFWVVEAP